MPRPLIGITSDHDEDAGRCRQPNDYATAVGKAGGIPVVLPYALDHNLIPELVDRLDGVIFMGGRDLDPRAYGEAPHPESEPLAPAREDFERALMAEVEKRRLPALGICLGCQLMNVYRGGNLHQFLPDLLRENAVEHRRLNPPEDPRHNVILEPDSTLVRQLGKREILANSSHKQAIRTLGKGLRISAFSPDGVIEGIEDPTFPMWIGVQWHPERLHDEKEHLEVFKLLVERIKQR